MVQGDTVREVLNYVQYNSQTLLDQFRKDVELAVREQRIGYEESGRLLKVLRRRTARLHVSGAVVADRSAGRSGLAAQPAEHRRRGPGDEQFWVHTSAAGESIRCGLPRSAVGGSIALHSGAGRGLRYRGACCSRLHAGSGHHSGRPSRSACAAVPAGSGAAQISIGLRTSSPVALLFGSEKFGLSNEDLSHCHWLLRIPTREEHGSMNLGQAVAICLYELHRSDQAAENRFSPAARQRPATTSALQHPAARDSGTQRLRKHEDGGIVGAEIAAAGTAAAIACIRCNDMVGNSAAGALEIAREQPRVNAILNPDDEGPDHV